MRKLLALALLAVTLLPIVNTLYYMSSMHQIVFSVEKLSTFQDLIIIQTVMVVVLIITYMVILAKSQSVPKDKKMLWGIALVAFNVLAMVIFWFHYIWKQPEYRPVSLLTE